jgi:hypothetical protein
LNRLASCWFKFSRSWRSFLPASTAVSSYRQTLAPQSTYICRVQSSVIKHIKHICQQKSYKLASKGSAAHIYTHMHMYMDVECIVQ